MPLITMPLIFPHQLSLKSDLHFSVSKKNTKNAPMKTADQTMVILIILCTYTVPFLTFTSCFKFSIPCKMVKGKIKHALVSFCCQPLENAFVFLNLICQTTKCLENAGLHKNCGTFSIINVVILHIWTALIGLLQLTITWYKICHAGEQAHYYSCTRTSK